MTTVFISGSISISRLNDDIRQRLQSIITQGFSVVVGDAGGMDKAVQQYLFDNAYKDVTVYCSGNRCRNNVGQWITNKIAVSPELKGRDFYTEKDKVMASDADYGFVLWDGKSQGSITNVLELVKDNKKALVYHSPKKTFYKILDVNDASELISSCDQELIKKLKSKLATLLPETQAEAQISLGF